MACSRRGPVCPRPAVFERDVVGATERMLAAAPDVGAIVLECSVFPAAGPAVRAATGLPVYHFVTLASMLMASVVAGPVRTLAAAE